MAKTTLITVLLLFCCHVSKALVVVQIRNSESLSSIVPTPPSLLVTNTRRVATTTALSSSSSSSDGDNDVLYSFGAEVVPEGQRPVNEYLDMKQAPLFGWGSNEVGTKGLLIRLGVVYAVVFAAV